MYYKIKQTKTNLHKYFHPSSLNQPILSILYSLHAMPKAKKVQQKFPNLRRQQGFAHLGVITFWQQLYSVLQYNWQILKQIQVRNLFRVSC